MTANSYEGGINSRQETISLERDFPIVEISQIAEQESWRKEINRPIYHIHKWWATRLGSVFRAILLGTLNPIDADTWNTFYQHHHFNDKIVLDPFMGSGTTIGEALKLGARAIGCDINPISTFLVQQAFTRVSEAELRAAFAQLEKRVAREINYYYQTPDRETGDMLPVLYFFWVKIVKTPTGETIPLMSRYVFAQDAYPQRKPRAQILCPNCWNLIEDRYDITDCQCPKCRHRFNPQSGPASGQYISSRNGHRYRIKDLLPSGGRPPDHRLYALMALRPNGDKIYLSPNDADVDLYKQAEAKLLVSDLPLPTLAVRAGYNTDQARGYNYLYWRDFFNARQLLCLGLLLRSILELDDVAVQEQMLCLFSSTLEFNNLFCSFKGEGTGAVRHMFSHHILKPERMPLENSVWGTEKSSGTFRTLFESRLIQAKRYLDEPFELELVRDLWGERRGARKTVASPPLRIQRVETWQHLARTDHSLIVLNGDSSRLPLPDAFVDAVVTDPPYFDFVHYSELSDFFFAWLSPVLKSRYPWFARPDSSNAGEVQHNDPLTFANQLASVFTECCRVLKDDGVLVFTFHHSRPEGWAAICEATARAGLVIVAAHPVHDELRAASPKAAAKDPVSIDAIMVCRKRLWVRDTGSDEGAVVSRSIDLANKLKAGGMSLSRADEFVIVASQALVGLSHKDLDFDAVSLKIREVSHALREAMLVDGPGLQD